MKINVIATSNFQKEAKNLIKKYKSLKLELSKLNSQLKSNPRKGISLCNNIFKIRLAVKSKGKGKSGGLRVVTYLEMHLISEENTLFLLSVYDKSNTESISKNDLLKLIPKFED